MAHAKHVLAAAGIADAIYHAGVRERLRESLGIEPTHPRICVQARSEASLHPDKTLVTRSAWRAKRHARRLRMEGYEPKTLALPPRAPRA